MQHLVSIKDREHAALHRVLVANGFSFMVHPGMEIGMHYVHLTKNLIVDLLRTDDGIFATVRDLSRNEGDRTVTEDSFSKFEYGWIEDAENEVEFLKRELHVLITVRPKLMTQLP